MGVYGIGRELPFTMLAWSEKIGLDFPLLSDATLVVAQASQTRWAAVAPVESVVGRWEAVESRRVWSPARRRPAMQCIVLGLRKIRV